MRSPVSPVSPGRRLSVVAVLAVMMGLVGCAAIPSSGPIEVVRESASDSGSTVRYLPARPDDGAEPQSIARGFLDAMLAYPVRSDIASAFLTKEAADRWRPNDKLTVYSGRPQVLPVRTVRRPHDPDDSEDQELRLRLRAVATVDRQGRYLHDARTVDVTWQLTRQSGQWRLQTPPDGLLVSSAWFSDYVRPFDIYFLDGPRRVVPSPVWEVVGDQLATSLVVSLARGPSARFDTGLSTAVPGLSRLRQSVPVAESVAQIEFQPSVRSLPMQRQEQLVAQLAWTMKAAPGVNEVAVTAGAPLSPRGSTGGRLDDWDDFGWSSRSGLAVVLGDRVRVVDDSSVGPLAGSWGSDARGATMISLGVDRVAAVSGNRAVVTGRDGSGAVVVSGRRWLSVQVDNDNRAWLVDRPDATRVRTVTDGTTRAIDTTAFGNRRVSALQVSPDSARYVAVLDGRLVFGRIVTGGGRATRLGPPSSIFTTVTGFASPSWLDGTHVTFIGDAGRKRQVFTTGIDGSATVSSVPGSLAVLEGTTPRTLVVVDGKVSILDSQGRVWSLDGPAWRKVDLGVSGRATAIG